MKHFQIFLIILIFLIQCKTANPPFIDDIAKFRQSDALEKPGDGVILFVGSSSFTYWTSVQSDFNNPKILNRGFGGSTLLDVWRYKEDVIFAYTPRQIVMYCGENDIASSESVTGYEVYKRFKKLYRSIRHKFPDVHFVYISLKPSPSRWHMRHRASEANRLINTFLTTEKNTVFINIWDKMMNENGYPIPTLFTNDSLHMNKSGYDIWVKELKQQLIK